MIMSAEVKQILIAIILFSGFAKKYDSEILQDLLHVENMIMEITLR